MTHGLGWTLLLLVAASFPARAAAPGAESSSQPAVRLRDAADGRLLVGAAVMTRHLADPAVAALVAREFNVVTAENEFKPVSLQPRAGEFYFDAGDKVIEFAQRHDIKVVGHTLLWHAQAPAFLFEDGGGKPLPRDQALLNLKVHIHAVAGHFRGKVMGWDVVNEALSDRPDEYLRDTPARRAIGDDYVIKAFEFAQAADPDAELYYNDYSIENAPKRDKALRLLKSLQAAGVRIDAVGIQSHARVQQQTLTDFDETITAFAALGLKSMLTELDVDVLPRQQNGADTSAREQAADPYVNGLPPDAAAAQAKYYADLFRLVLKHQGQVSRVTFWGTHDGTSWLNDWPVPGRTNHPLLWDRDLRPKPAYGAILDVLSKK